MLRFIGIDPGLQTGLISFSVNDDEIHCVESYELSLIEVGNYFEQLPPSSSTVVSYEVSNKFQASGHLSSEVIGLCRFFTLKAGCDFISVTQSAHKRLITRDVLKRAGLYVKGVHAKDAAGIALFTVVTGYKLVPWVLRSEED